MSLCEAWKCAPPSVCARLLRPRFVEVVSACRWCALRPLLRCWCVHSWSVSTGMTAVAGQWGGGGGGDDGGMGLHQASLVHSLAGVAGSVLEWKANARPNTHRCRRAIGSRGRPPPARLGGRRFRLEDVAALHQGERCGVAVDCLSWVLKVGWSSAASAKAGARSFSAGDLGGARCAAHAAAAHPAAGRASRSAPVDVKVSCRPVTGVEMCRDVPCCATCCGAACPIGRRRDTPHRSARRCCVESDVAATCLPGPCRQASGLARTL